MVTSYCNFAATTVASVINSVLVALLNAVSVPVYAGLSAAVPPSGLVIRNVLGVPLNELVNAVSSICVVVPVLYSIMLPGWNAPLVVDV